MKRVMGAVITGALFAALIVLLGRYDVAAIGPAGTEVGFSHINQFVHNLTGVNMLWYEITDYIGYGAIAVCGMFALAGFIQMIKRRSLLKVDREIWALDKPEPQALITAGVPGGLTYTVRVWVKTTDYWSEYGALMKNIPAALNKAGIARPSTPISVSK